MTDVEFAILGGDGVETNGNGRARFGDTCPALGGGRSDFALARWRRGAARKRDHFVAGCRRLGGRVRRRERS